MKKVESVNLKTIKRILTEVCVNCENPSSECKQCKMKEFYKRLKLDMMSNEIFGER